MKYFLFIFLFVITNTSFAVSSSFSPSIEQSSCYDIDDNKVTIFVLKETSLYSDVAVAGYRNDRPSILINPEIVDKLSPPAVELIFHHECGHHALGHIKHVLMKDYVPHNERNQFENDADCFSVQRFLTHHTISQLENVIDELKIVIGISTIREQHILSCIK